MKVRLVDEVYDDLRTLRDWYDKKRDGLGGEFVEVFFEPVNALPHRATHSPIDETGFRPKRMPRFTAVIYYVLTDSEIVVVGVVVNGRSTSNLESRGVTIACNGLGGRAAFEVSATRVGPWMRNVRSQRLQRDI